MKKMNIVLLLLLALAVAAPSFTFAAAASADQTQTIAGKININTADAQSLTAVPGIGPKTAENILAHRQQNGAFQSVDDLVNVKGIGEKSLAKMKSYLTI